MPRVRRRTGVDRLSRAVTAARRALGRLARKVPSAADSARSGLATTRGRMVAAGALVAPLVILAVVLSGGDGGGPTGSADAGDRAEGREGPSERVAEVLGDMSTDRKVAQLMLVGLEGADSGDPVFSSFEERDYAGLVLEDQNYFSPDQVVTLADEAVSTASKAQHVTPLVLAPQQGGDLNAFADLPPDDAPAEVGSPREAADAARESAEALEKIGITGVIGPVLDVGTEPGSALGASLYSDEPDDVKAYGLDVLEELRDADLFAAVEHFPGLGGASQSPDFGPANVGLSLEQLADRDLIPFEAAIHAGVPGIVVGHGLYGVDDFVTPASMSETIMTDLLRDDLGFEGVAIADDLTSPAITAAFDPAEAAVESVRSGADLVYVSVDDEQQGEVYDALSKAVRREEITPERLDQAVTRTLVAKEKVGLLEEEGEGSGGGGD